MAMAAKANHGGPTGSPDAHPCSVAAMDRRAEDMGLRVDTNLSSVPYRIHSCSGHLASYFPERILVDDPSDQSSRWTSGKTTDQQFIVLELESPAILHQITFGKFDKAHICNLREFQVLGGMHPSNMMPLLKSGLRNDNEPETHPLLHIAHGIKFPCRYIKIVPLLAWGDNFSVSVWFVRLKGLVDPVVVLSAAADFDALKEREAIRLCLKHLRQRSYLDCFERLQKRTKVVLEAPALTDLYELLVTNGDFQEAQKRLADATDGDSLQPYIRSLPHTPEWSLISVSDEVPPGDAQPTLPGRRGGHQMCMNPTTNKLYLYGGWDGISDLSDLWEYDVEANSWTRLSADTSEEGGPDARSCHKMCIDEQEGHIYVLGKYVDTEARQVLSLRSDFFRYDIASNSWTLLSADTSQMGGPRLIYDHQMSFDSDSKVLYVFGGRVLTRESGPDSSPGAPSNSSGYSGLFSYNAISQEWTLLRGDLAKGPDHVRLASRIGHSMLLDTKRKLLFMYAGQRNKDYLSDLYQYDVASNTLTEICHDSSKHAGPDPTFTQRATIDSTTREIFVLSGLEKRRSHANKAEDVVKNSFWVYNIDHKSWHCAYKNNNSEPGYWSRMGKVEPCPRFAHQLVYNPLTKMHYLFGGNPGGNPGHHGRPNLRLGDFWSLQLVRPSPESVRRRCHFLVARQQFIELCETTEVSQLVDHADPEEETAFRELPKHLFLGPKDEAEAPRHQQARHQQRLDLFEHLLQYFPPDMQPPQGSLADLVSF